MIRRTGPISIMVMAVFGAVHSQPNAASAPRGFYRRRIGGRNAVRFPIDKVPMTRKLNPDFMKLLFAPLAIAFFAPWAAAQVPLDTQVQILKAEDARAYGEPLEALMASPNANVRVRAALAAGRIGNERAVTALAKLLDDTSPKVRETAAFALGEIESINGADAIISVLSNVNAPGAVRARAVEAAGKIAAANAKDERSKELGRAIVAALDAESKKGPQRDRNVVLLAVTAVLRTKAERGDISTATFLTDSDPRIRADAANTLARLRSKSGIELLRKMLLTDPDAAARANSARALGAANDKESINLLVRASADDADQRVRVSAIRSLAALKERAAGARLLARGRTLVFDFRKSKFAQPSERSEIIEIASALGQIFENSNDQPVKDFLDGMVAVDNGMTPEFAVARLKVAPGRLSARDESKTLSDWRQYATLAQLLTEFAKLKPDSEEGKKMLSEAPAMARLMAEIFSGDVAKDEERFSMAAPDFLRAFAAYKTSDLSSLLRAALANKDVFIRAAAAELLGEEPASPETFDALAAAFYSALKTDRFYNDAQLALLDASFKIDKRKSVRLLIAALDAPDYLIRKKAFELLSDDQPSDSSSEISSALLRARAARRDQVLPYNPASGTRLGQILNTDADYRRAASRKNGTVKAVLTTEKGTFTIDLLPEDAPMTVDNFVKLARANYFNGLEVHRVVPNFVMQDGDPRGDGNGGPGWSIRCELNMVPFDRGSVGMALSGKDTGGSQWFVTHSPQPHLDGGYTVFGRVNESDMKVVDNIVRGDKIISVKIVEGAARPRK